MGRLRALQIELDDDKTCVVCGRRIEWRRKWADQWHEITRCSERCRKMRLDKTDEALEEALIAMARARGRRKSFMLSEAAQKVSPLGWMPLMERTLMAARRLVARGELLMLQGGRAVDPSTARGAVHLRRP
ncbi:MAG: DUF3253 domain-containing protein [Bradymonadia bacterium]